MFFARDKEISMINSMLERKSGSAMIYGKRKVGKTTLLTYALRKSGDKTVYYECLKSTVKDNIEGFVSVLVREKVIPVLLDFKSFTDVFAYLNTLDGTYNIIIYEYPYLKEMTKPETVDSVFQSIMSYCR